MKHLLTALLLLTAATAWAQRPDFDLYFANNVTDVVNFDSIKSPNSGLKWTKVQTATGDMAGNYVEVDNLKQMLSTTRMKNKADQQQFWTMRDHSLLCFHIVDPKPSLSGYEVLLSNGRGDSLTMAANDFFFVNLPLQIVPYEIKVYRADQPDRFYRFRYFIQDWDNDRLYIFQLDQRRQATGKNYQLEYTVGSLDEDGEMEQQTTVLDLQASKFQSFYVPDGKDLVDVVLNDDGNRLRLDKTKIHAGIDLNDRFTYMELSGEFFLDKHENREFMNFNWVGSGLYEKYDTLYLSIWNDRARLLENITCHVVTVDADGKPAANIGAKYIGYDKTRKAHKILTMGRPAYLEIISRGYLPTVYKYAGAADAETGIVSEARCIANLTLRSGNVTENALTISDQHFLFLNDEKTIITRGGVDHALCTIDPIDLAGIVQADTLIYMEDAGQQYPKLLDNRPVERFAKMQVAFSRPQGASVPDCTLFATDLDTHAIHEATDKEVTTILASEYKSFTYDYYYVDFNLLDVIPVGSVCSINLQSGKLAYNQFPFLKNIHMDREEDKKKASDEVNDNWVGDSKGLGGFADAGLDIRFPFEFKMSFKPVTVSTAFVVNPRKHLANLKITIQMNRNGSPDESQKTSEAREEMKTLEKYNYMDIDDTKRVSAVGSDKKFDDWIYKDIDDIFNISSKRIGTGWFGQAKFNFTWPCFDFSRFQVTEVSGQIGYGVGMFWGNLADNPKFKPLAGVLKKLEKFVSFSGCAEASAQVDFGIKSYDKGAESSMSSTNMGYFAHFSAKASAGATLQMFTPKSIGGVNISWLFNANAGLRFGGKLGFQAGLEGPFDSYVPGMGVRFTGMIVGQAFLNIKTFFCSFSASAGFHLGGQLLIPDNPHNPFHSGFPYWLNEAKARPLAKVYSPLRKLEANELGRTLASDVAIDANPHFLGSNAVVYNDLKDVANYNDDQITLLNTDDGTSQALSDLGTTATNHMRSKRGDHEVVVFEQKSRSITDEEVNSDDAVAISFALPTHIKAAMRSDDGQWTVMNVTEPDAEDGKIDIKPIVTIQDDGHAACIYQHGASYAVDSSVPMDSVMNVQFAGQLMLKTFDGTHWSEPVPLYAPIDPDHAINQYDLLMRNDTVLVAANLLYTDLQVPVLRYASVPLSTQKATYTDDAIVPIHFMMQRVGQNAVVAMVYNEADSVPDIYVRSLSMEGPDASRPNGNLNTGYKVPARVKIVCDRDAQDLSDFAVLWTESNNVYRGDDGTETYSDNICTMLNASRIHLGQTLQLTDPITVGAEQDGLMMTDFDGFLDDAHISVVYTLGDPETGAGMVMANDKYFRNSCEAEVSYARSALQGSSSLPVSVRIRNTGTSPVIGITAVINGTPFNVEDVYVAPAKEKTYTVLYPIDDDFDGYISSSISVEYNNIFKTEAHPRHRALNYRRQLFMSPRTRLAVADVECNVVSQSIEEGVNTFVVELIDRGGLPADIGVRTGVYAHPSQSEPLDDTAEVMVRGDEFVQMGDVRKAYVTVSVRGITEPLQAYVNCHVVDTNFSTDNLALAHIKNLHGNDNPSLVNLFPTSDPTAIVRPQADGLSTDHRIQVETTDDGVLLSSLLPDEQVRIFNAAGFAVCKRQASGTTMFVPLAQHGVYVLSTEAEVFKFKY